jgi:hypothetical protein
VVNATTPDRPGTNSGGTPLGAGGFATSDLESVATVTVLLLSAM